MSEPKRKYKIPAMEAVYPPRFEAGDKAAEAFFQENGYAVYKDVATAEELQRGEDLFWAWMEEFTDVVRNDLSTWENRRWPGYTGLGIINSNGVGQSEFLWFVRGLRPIHTLFSDLWHDDDLISSFDGCGAFRPIQKNPEWTTKTGWYHTDQNGHSKPGLKSIQGLLNFYDSGPEDGGLVLVPGSNKYFEEMYRRFPTIAHPDGNDQVRIDETAFEEWTALAEEWSLRPIKACLHPGDFVVWDSRTIHCNTPPSPVVHNEFPRHDLRRLVAYVSMSPVSSVVDFGVLEKRKNAYFAGIACNHWAHEFHPIRGCGPEGFRPPVLDAHQKALVCGREYDWGEEGVSSSSSTHFFQKGQFTKKKKSSKK